MSARGTRTLKRIERGLLADDPQFAERFRQGTAQLAAVRPDRPAGPVVVAVDDSLASMRAVRWAALRAREDDADLRVVHAFRWRSYPLDYGMVELQDLDEQAAGRVVCSSALDLAAALSPRSRATGMLVSGGTGPAVVRAATGAAVLVLRGSRRRTPTALLGSSTLRHVLARARCTVALLPAGLPPTVTSSRVVVGTCGRAGDRAALAEALRTARTGGCGVLVLCPPGCERATTAAVEALRPRGGPAVDVRPAGGPVVEELARLANGAAAVVCARSQVDPAGPWRGRAGRVLLDSATCPVLLTSPPRGVGQ